jgi:hypothetical protein
LQAVEARSLHPDIEEYQTRPPTSDLIETTIRVMRLARLEAFILEDAGNEVADIVFVVDDENI